MDLQEITARLGIKKDPKLLIGFDQADDAAVYLVREDLGLVQTTDFITPLVDDPFEFGQIAAANALSDVYAKGGQPLTALNICCFPGDMDRSVLQAILEGGLSKINESGALLVGGHTVKDPELKYGLAVTGVVHPNEIKPNSSAKAGDAIVLTKAIGTGVISTAIKKGIADQQAVLEVVKSMTFLNRIACEGMHRFKAHAATDITGFGLAVHLLRVARASYKKFEIHFGQIPVFPTVMQLLKSGIKTGVTFANEQEAHREIRFDELLSREEQLLFFDPQTSGGLAIFLPEERASELIEFLQQEGIQEARTIGRVLEGSPSIEVIP